MKKNFTILSVIFTLFIFNLKSAQAQCIPSVGNLGATGDYISSFSFGALSNIGSGDYFNDYALYPQTASFMQAVPYRFTIQTGSLIWPQHIGIWIDYDGNGSFAGPGEFVYTTSSPAFSSAILTGTISIPFTASMGIHRMRICAKSTIAITASESCGIPNFGEYEDYEINIIPNAICAGLPSAGNALAFNATPCPGATTNVVLSNYTFSTTTTFQWLQGTICNGPWIPISSGTTPSALTSSLSITALSGVSKGYRCKVTCNTSGLSDTSTVACVSAIPWTCTGPCYGVSTATSPTSQEILNVTMNNLNNSTTCANPLIGSQGIAIGSPNKYANFSGLNGVPPAILYQGSSRNFSLTLGSCTSTFPTSAKIYIDYNQNGSFVDPGEEVYSNNSIPTIVPAAIINNSFIPPLTAMTGCTRMRVICMSTNLGAISPTGPYTWGETEDYTVNILQQSLTDPAVASINLPSGNCYTASESVTLKACNYGSNDIHLATNPANIILFVNGPSGNTTYSITMNAGILSASGAACPTFTIPGVNLSMPGQYKLNASIKIPTLLNGNLFNDTLNEPVNLTAYAAPEISCTVRDDCDGQSTGAVTSTLLNFPYKLFITNPNQQAFDMRGAAFGPNITNTPLNGDIMYYSNPDDGCNAYLPGTFAGKIALIDRGSCLFEQKVFNAESAGAIGVIIVNNVPDSIFTMGAANLYSLNIPAIMISQVDGLTLKSLLNTAPIVSCKTASYSFLWNNGATTNSINWIPAGTYSVVVTDEQSCIATCSKEVPLGLYPIVVANGIADCNLSNNGSVDLIMTNFPYFLNVNSPIATQFAMTGANFGPDIETNAFAASIKYYASPDTGCMAYPPGTFAGKIALIDRGSCPFELKVFNAQNAGAIGVIIVNNVTDPIFTMGAVNLYPINITAIMISQVDGLIIKNLLSQPDTVNCNTKLYFFNWNTLPGITTSSVSGLAPGYYPFMVSDNSCAWLSGYEVNGPIEQPEITTIGKSILCNDSVVLASVEPGLALHLNGLNQWVDLGADITNMNDGNFTIEAWIRTTGVNEGIVASGNNDSIWEPGERLFFVDTFGRPAFVGFDNNYIVALPSVNDGNWHHVAVSWNNDYKIGRMFVDGVDQTFFVNYTASTFANIGQFSIGRPNFGEATHFFNGDIDEVKIWNTGRAQSQILAGMSVPENINAISLLAYYKMNDGAGLYLKELKNGLHGTLINSPTFITSGAFGNSYVWSTTGNAPTTLVTNPGTYDLTITTPSGCVATSNALAITNTSTITASGPTTFCTGGSVEIKTDAALNNLRFASGVLGLSSQYQLNSWGAVQALGMPNVYPNYGDISGAWASSQPDAIREHLELSFTNPASINFVDIYETLAPGAVDTIYVKNPNTGLFEIVYSGAAIPQPLTARIMHVSFPATTFPVSEIRIALNSLAVPDWNEIDAVAIGFSPNYLWSNGASTQNLLADSSGSYQVSVTYPNGCSKLSNQVVVDEMPCNVACDLKLFIEGYYLGSAMMQSVLMNQGETTNAAIVDTIKVELHEQNFPYALIDSAQVILNTNGSSSATFNALANAYYIAIKHRNGNYTWSSMPISLGPIPTTYNFSSSMSQAYGDNQREVESGIWAFYSGDLNQDENVDLGDFTLLELDINNFEFGFKATDINGDGSVDLQDVPLLELNSNLFIFSSHP